MPRESCIMQSKTLPKFLNKNQTEAVIESLDKRKCMTGLRDRVLLLLMLDAGMRRAEAANMKADSIDWDAGKHGGAFIIGKGGKERPIFFSERLAEALRDWMDQRPVDAETVLTNVKGDHAGKPMTGKNVYNIVKQYAGCNPHKLRHTLATKMLQNGANIRTVQKALGHSRLDTTMIYTHVMDEDLESAFV